ncbi:hypothetical protein [Peribacillus kribbensis]|uniref:hypothetical protein n=1 Tax=Peribacillus kribbensis TaxID=356658 RepID=UPI0003FDC486|nr:hypothetical protein [Peribacillus kribbensis]
MSEETMHEFLRILQNFEHGDIQIAVRHASLFNVETIRSYRFQQNASHLMISSQGGGTNFQLAIMDVLRIENVQKSRDTSWRAAAYEIHCSDLTLTVIMNILSSKEE